MEIVLQMMTTRIWILLLAHSDLPHADMNVIVM